MCWGVGGRGVQIEVSGRGGVDWYWGESRTCGIEESEWRQERSLGDVDRNAGESGGSVGFP